MMLWRPYCRMLFGILSLFKGRLVPVSFEVDGGVIFLRMAGAYSMTELRDAVVAALDAPESANAIGMVLNVSESEALKTRTADDVTSMGYFLASKSDRFSRRIALVASEDFRFGMMRLGSAALEQLRVDNQVFRTEAEGINWLRTRPETAS